MNGKAASMRSVKRHVLKLASGAGMDLKLVAAVAGDRTPSQAETGRILRMRKKQGQRFFSELLFSITNEYYPYEEAERIWYEVLDHKQRLHESLGRNPGIVVTALDYLLNIRKDIPSAEIIAAPKMQAIARIAMKDELTGLFARAAFNSKLRHELRRHQRYGNAVSLILIDIDDFKRINDTQGHRRGDLALARVGRFIRHVVRDVDIPCRYGGEEFGVILPQTEIHDAVEIAQRLSRGVVEEFGHDLCLTVSIGVANCPMHAHRPGPLIDAADHALYRAKGEGKNRIAVAGSGVVPDREPA
jgi:diguanylate cyclase (GGDEF)-like protein